MPSSHPIFNRRFLLVVLLIMFAACASLAKTFNFHGDLVFALETAVGGDTALHAIIALLLGFSAYWATPRQYHYLSFYKLPPVMTLLLGLVVIDESSQAFLPQRQFSFDDMVINIVGLLLGALIYRIWLYRVWIHINRD